MFCTVTDCSAVAADDWTVLSTSTSHTELSKSNLGLGRRVSGFGFRVYDLVFRFRV